MHSQARKAKARKHDLNYYQTRAEDLEQENNLLNTKLVSQLKRRFKEYCKMLLFIYLIEAIAVAHDFVTDTLHIYTLLS